MLVTFTNGSTEHYDDEPFAQGGQGTLHLSRDKRSVIKLYHQPDTSRVAALDRIINNYNVTKIAPMYAHLFAWPNGIVQSPRLGVRTTNVNYQLEHKSLTWWIGARTYKRLDANIRGNWLDRVYVARDMARIAWQLHGNGLCHSDFSGDNFMTNVAHQRVVLIDLDSLVEPGVMPPEMLGTGDYMAPEIVIARMKAEQRVNKRMIETDAKPSIFTDLHSLAVLIYQLLLMAHPLRGPKQHDPDPEKDDLLALGEQALYIEDPIDPSNRPKGEFNGAWLLGEEVESLMRRAFTVGLHSPMQRPQAVEWSDALLRLTEQVIPCSNVNCTGRAFVLLRDQPAICPWCKEKVARPAQVPVLRWYNGSGQIGHFQHRQNRTVGWQKRTLHRWHVQPGYSEQNAKQPDERRPVAEFHYSQSKWTLTNLAIPDMRVAARGSVRRVAIDEKLTLEDGQQLLLGAGDSSVSARLALVSMQKL
ncbi:MAG: hypothetical protein IT324_14250 [Anaerolineae bacterium]|nr:hypothetical protein [Anaerolineae bacterium]